MHSNYQGFRDLITHKHLWRAYKNSSWRRCKVFVSRHLRIWWCLKENEGTERLSINDKVLQNGFHSQMAYCSWKKPANIGDTVRRAQHVKTVRLRIYSTRMKNAYCLLKDTSRPTCTAILTWDKRCRRTKIWMWNWGEGRARGSNNRISHRRWQHILEREWDVGDDSWWVSASCSTSPNIYGLVLKCRSHRNSKRQEEELGWSCGGNGC